MKQDKEIAEKKLAELIEAARTEKNPLGHGDLSAMLSKAPNPTFQKPLTNIKTILMTASIATLGIILVYSLVTINGDEKAKPVVLSQISVEAEIQSPVAPNKDPLNEPVQKISPISKQITEKPISTVQEKNKEAFQIKGENLLTLSEEKLKILGVSYGKDGICMTINEALAVCYNQRGSKIWYDKKKPTGAGLQIHPLMVTDDLGKNWRSTALSDKLESEFKSLYPDVSSSNKDFAQYDKAMRSFINTKINSLVPILVHLPEEFLRPAEELDEDSWRPNLILWYEPTDSLLAIIGNTAEPPAASVPGPAPAVTTTEGPITLKIGISSIYPNPSVDEATVVYYLEKEKAVSIALHDISGKLVKVYVNGEKRSAGENQLTVNVKDLIPGIYLLSIQTEDGNIFSQRLIKQ